MDHSIRLRGKTTIIREVTSVVAIHPAADLAEAAGAADSKVVEAYGNLIARGAAGHSLDTALSAAQRLGFEAGGWRFVEPKPAIKEAAAICGSTENAEPVRNIFESDNGTLIATNRVTLQLVKDFPPAEAKKEIEKDGLSIVRKLSFADNLYEAQLTGAIPLLELVQRLQDLTAKYKFIEPVFIENIGTRAVPAPADFKSQWHHLNGFGGDSPGIQSPSAWEVTRGAGVRIAVIDQGMQVSHPGFASAIDDGGYFITSAAGRTTFRKWMPGTSGFPDFWHGTFCLGMAGARANSSGVCGSAPEANLFPIACAGYGIGTQLALARAIAFAAEPSREDLGSSPAKGADIIVSSLGPTDGNSGVWRMSSALELAITSAANAGRQGLGIPIFWASSNGPHDISDDEVCSHPDVLAISRSNRNDREDGAAYGSKLEFLAPGVEVFSTDSGGAYTSKTGCSYSAPLAAGVAALVIARNPGFTRDQIRGRLGLSCDKVGGVSYDSEGRNSLYGYGRINANSAVSDTLA